MITPLSLVLTAVVGDQARQLLYFGFAALPVLFAMVVYLIWMFRDPDRLQSEEYRVKQQVLKYLYTKGGSTELLDSESEMARIEIVDLGRDHGEKE